MRERKPIIDNPVYSEILIKINTEKVYTFDFIKKFKNKERSVLARQLQVLKDMEYLILEDIKEVRDKQEIKFKGNLKYYKIDWEKLLLDFYKVLVVFAKEKKEENEELYNEDKESIVKKDFDEKYKKLKTRKFKMQLINSNIFHDYMGFLLKELNDNYDKDVRLKNITLRNVFLEIFEMGLYISFEEFVNVINMENITKPNLLYDEKDIEKKKDFDNKKIEKYEKEIKFVYDYYFILEGLGLGSKFYEELTYRISEKLEQKYIKQ